MASKIVLLGPNFMKELKGCRKPTTIDYIGGIFCNICHTTFSNKKDYDTHYVHHSLGSKDIAYTCIVCHREITGYSSFRNHCYQTHVNKERFRCEFCSKAYSKQSVLNGHIETVHNFKCTSCHEKFPSKKDLQTHQIVHKSEKDKLPYPCQACSKPIDTLDVCELHVDEHSTFLYPCSLCNETASSKVQAAIHLTTHFNDELDEELLTETPQMNEESSLDILGGILCCYCDELFKNRLEFDTHFVTEHGDQQLVYSCNICGKQFEKYSQFGNHCYCHITKDKFECTECLKSFPRLSLLIVHTEAYHADGADGANGARGANGADGADGERGAVGSPFKCTLCARAYKCGARLREHLRAEHAVHCVPCPHPGCDETFESIKDLVLHQRTHRPSDVQRCRQCGLRLRSLWAAARHLDVHRRKHYACPVCARAYREKYLLLKHLTPHFQTTLHVCNTCGRVFNAKNRLVEHLKVHSVVRGHICSICGKGFVKAHQLEQHLNVHTGNKPYKCTECPKEFASYPNLCKHLRRMHNTGMKQRTLKGTEMPVAEKNESSSNDKSIIESGIDSTSSELSIETRSMAESDESTIDSIDPVVQTGLAWAESSVVDSGIDCTDLLRVNDASFDSAMLQDPTVTGTHPQELGYPLEYGPDFGQRGVDPDDYCLPHIDPLLTIKNQIPEDMYVNTLDNPMTIDQNWEPYITKVYSYDENDLSRLPIMNIF